MSGERWATALLILSAPLWILVAIFSGLDAVRRVDRWSWIATCVALGVFAASAMAGKAAGVY